MLPVARRVRRAADAALLWKCTIFKTVVGLDIVRFLRYVLKNSTPWSGYVLSAQLLQALCQLRVGRSVVRMTHRQPGYLPLAYLCRRCVVAPYQNRSSPGIVGLRGVPSRPGSRELPRSWWRARFSPAWQPSNRLLEASGWTWSAGWV